MIKLFIIKVHLSFAFYCVKSVNGVTKITRTKLAIQERYTPDDTSSSTDLRGEQRQLHQTKELGHVFGTLFKVVLQPYHQGLQGSINDQDCKWQE